MVFEWYLLLTLQICSVVFMVFSHSFQYHSVVLELNWFLLLALILYHYSVVSKTKWYFSLTLHRYSMIPKWYLFLIFTHNHHSVVSD